MENNVVTVSLDHADEPVGAVVQIVLGREQRPAGYCAICYRDGLHLNADKLSFAVIGVVEAYLYFISKLTFLREYSSRTSLYFSVSQ